MKFALVPRKFALCALWAAYWPRKTGSDSCATRRDRRWPCARIVAHIRCVREGRFSRRIVVHDRSTSVPNRLELCTWSFRRPPIRRTCGWGDGSWMRKRWLIWSGSRRKDTQIRWFRLYELVENDRCSLDARIEIIACCGRVYIVGSCVSSRSRPYSIIFN